MENNGCPDQRECNVGMFSILPCSIPISIHTDTSDKGRVPSAARIDLEIDSQARPSVSPSHVVDAIVAAPCSPSGSIKQVRPSFDGARRQRGAERARSGADADGRTDGRRYKRRRRCGEVAV